MKKQGFEIQPLFEKAEGYRDHLIIPAMKKRPSHEHESYCYFLVSDSGISLDVHYGNAEQPHFGYNTPEGAIRVAKAYIDYWLTEFEEENP